MDQDQYLETNSEECIIRQQQCMAQDKDKVNVNALITLELESETQALLQDLRQLQQLAERLQDLLQSSQGEVTQIREHLETTESEVSYANDTLLSALKRRDFGAGLSGVAGIAALGGVAGCYLGSTLLTGGVVGAAGAAALALGSGSAVGFYNQYKSHALVSMTSTTNVNASEEKTDIILDNDANNELSSLKTKDVEKMPYSSEKIWDNLREALKVAQKTKVLVQNSNEELIIQGETLERSLVATCRIRSLLLTGKILVDGLQQNFLIYFLRLLTVDSKTPLLSQVNQLIREKIAIEAKVNASQATKQDSTVDAGGQSSHQLTIGDRYYRYRLPFIQWREIKREDLFALQCFWNQYRIVAINPSDLEVVKKIYRFKMNDVDQAYQLFDKIVNLIRWSTCSIKEAKELYTVLDRLPALDELRVYSGVDGVDSVDSDVNPQYLFEPILNQILSVVRHQIRLSLDKLKRELDNQNALNESLNHLVEEATIDVKQNNKKLRKKIDNSHIFYGGMYR